MARPPVAEWVGVDGDLSRDQSAESTWWIGLLSWIFIYVGRKDHFNDREMSGLARVMIADICSTTTWSRWQRRASWGSVNDLFKVDNYRLAWIST